MRSFKDAKYITGSSNDHRGIYNSGKNLYKISGILLVLSLLLGALFVPGLTSSKKPSEVSVAEAWSISLFCDGNLGSNMSLGDKNNWHSSMLDGSYPGENQRRRLLADEAFGHSLAWFGYEGETGDDERRDEWARDDGRGGPTEPSKFTADNVGGQGEREAARSRVYSARTWTNCATNDSWLTIASTGLIVAKTLTALNGLISTKIFSGNLVCETPDASAVNDIKNGCLDLLWITGGDGSEGSGIIGTFTSGIYLPLLLLMGLSVAVWVAWRGIVKRAFREALFGALWAFGAVIIGLALLLNPALVARGPAVVANTLSGCIVSTFGGNNCLTNEPSSISEISTTTTSDKICSPDLSAVPASENMGLIAASLNCSIWKAFVLEPWTSANFGEGFNAMDTANPERQGAKLAKRANVDSGAFNAGREGFCVSLTPTGTIRSAIEADTLQLSGGQKICNIALFQLYVMTNAQDSGNMPNICSNEVCSTGQADLNWYKIIDATSTSDNAWNAWGGGKTASVSKIFTGGMMAVTSLVGNVVLITIGIFAVVYYLSAVLLMMLAPLFLLIGIHPGKGRDILKGWGEMVLSNLFKYLMSTIFLIIALVLYGGVLGASTSPGMTLIVTLILSVALFMYRKELVDMFGTVSMGGKQLGAGVANGFKNNASRLAKTTAGAAVGGAMGGGVKGAWAATTENAGRELRRQGGIMGNVGHGLGMGAETANRMNRDEIKSMIESNRDEASTASANTEAARDVANVANEEFDQLVSQLSQLNSEIDTKVREINSGGGDKLIENLKSSDDVVTRGLATIAAIDADLTPMLGKEQAMHMTIKNLSNQIDSATDAEKPELLERRAALEAEKEQLEAEIYSKMETQEQIKAEFMPDATNDQINAELESINQQVMAADRKLAEDINEYNSLVESFNTSAATVGEKRSAAIDANNALTEAQYAEAQATANNQALEDSYSEVRSNKALNKGDKKKIAERASARAAAAANAEMDQIQAEAEARYQEIAGDSSEIERLRGRRGED